LNADKGKMDADESKAIVLFVLPNQKFIDVICVHPLLSAFNICV